MGLMMVCALSLVISINCLILIDTHMHAQGCFQDHLVDDTSVINLESNVILNHTL